MNLDDLIRKLECGPIDVCTAQFAAKALRNVFTPKPSEHDDLLADLAEQSARPGDYADLAATAIRQLQEEVKSAYAAKERLYRDMDAACDKAVLAEREACAQIAEAEPRVWDADAPPPQQRIAAKIRAQGNVAP